MKTPIVMALAVAGLWAGGAAWADRVVGIASIPPAKAAAASPAVAAVPLRTGTLSEEAVFNFRHCDRRAAADAEGHEFGAIGDGLGRLLDVFFPQLLFHRGDRPANFLKDRLPESGARKISADMRRQLKVDATDGHRLGQPHLQFAHAAAAD